MPAYVFKGKTRAGAATSGERTADSKDAVIAMLRREQILVTSVKEKGKEIALPKFGGGISHKDVAIFTRQFSVMIDAGLPLVQCLEILGTQQDNPGFQKVLLQVRQDVEGGSSLADAMKKHKKVFDDLFTNMIAAGEAGGILDTILKRLFDLYRKIRQADSAGQVGDGLSDCCRLHRGPRRRGHPVEGHPDLRRLVRGARCAVAASYTDRHRAFELDRAFDDSGNPRRVRSELRDQALLRNS